MRWKNGGSLDAFAHGGEDVVRRLLLRPRVRLQAVLVVGACGRQSVGLEREKGRSGEMG